MRKIEPRWLIAPDCPSESYMARAPTLMNETVETSAPCIEIDSLPLSVPNDTSES